MSITKKDIAFENDLTTLVGIARSIGLLSPIMEKELYREVQFIDKSEYLKESQKLIKQGEINMLKQLIKENSKFAEAKDLEKDIEKRVNEIGVLQGEINGLQAYRFRLKHRWEQILLDLRNAVKTKSVKGLQGIDDKEIEKLKSFVQEMNQEAA